MRIMTKLLALMLALMLTACAALAEDGDQLLDIQSKGEIVVATEGAWAPWTYHDEAGTLVGFDVEVAQAIAAKLGVTATFAETEWDGIFAGLDSGRYDIAAIQMVLSGRADATLNAEVSFYDYMNAHPDANLKVVALTDEASQVAIPVRKEARSAALLAAINQAISELDAEGELSRISEKYFGKDISRATAE